jgi:ribose-phosphate pyrophosphokinase
LISVPPASAAARAPLCILACDDARDLAGTVARQLGVPLTASHDVWFACGEGKHVIEANIRGTDTYVFQRPIVPGDRRTVYDRMCMLLHAVDAARCADADRVTVILPYFPGSRQDKRKGNTREGVSTGLFARLLQSAGVSMVVTIQPHEESMIGCYDPSRTVFEGLPITHAFGRYFAEQGLKPDVVASTDLGGLEMARMVAQHLSAGIVALSKERDYSRPNTVASTQVIGDVAGKSVLIVDDIIDTAGSLVSAAQALWAAGAGDLTVAAAHLLASDPAWERLHALAAEAQGRGVAFRLVGTSGIRHAHPPGWYRDFAIEPLLAGAIRSINTRGSVRAVEG